MSGIDALQPNELGHALGLLLATPGSGCGANRSTVRAFIEHLESSPARWEGWRCGASPSPTALFLAVLLPGSTAIAMIPTPNELGIQPADQHQLTLAALERLRRHRLHFAQALLLPEAQAQRRLLRRVGFRRLATLVYMERDVKYPWVDPPAIDEAVWVAFSRHTQDEFATTLLATYQDSLDCPELAQLRPVADIIAGHQAAGRFNPSLWELLRVDGAGAACLLLAPLADSQTVELVYMGVVPTFRKRGLGFLLLQRALQQCRAHGARRLTVAVDDRNQPAKRLYRRFALRLLARRTAYLYRWPGACNSPRPTGQRG